MVRFARLTVFLLYALEAGFILIVAPWTELWERSYPVWHSLGLHLVLDDPVARGLVSGVGGALILDALIEALKLGRDWRGPP